MGAEVKSYSSEVWFSFRFHPQRAVLIYYQAFSTSGFRKNDLIIDLCGLKDFWSEFRLSLLKP